MSRQEKIEKALGLYRKLMAYSLERWTLDVIVKNFDVTFDENTMEVIFTVQVTDNNFLNTKAWEGVMQDNKVSKIIINHKKWLVQLRTPW